MAHTHIHRETVAGRASAIRHGRNRSDRNGSLHRSMVKKFFAYPQVAAPYHITLRERPLIVYSDTLHNTDIYKYTKYIPTPSPKNDLFHTNRKFPHKQRHK